jgi:tRNA(Ile)-lysidine synthase
MKVLSSWPLLQQVAGYIRRQKMLAPNQRIGVAVSGGADSVVLLHMLLRLRGEITCELHVLHVNHHLRAAESDADEAFVRELARDLGLPIFVEHTLAPSTGIEQQARDLRRAFFQRAASAHGLQRVALGHTRSDQAETVLFRLFRGSGLTGLAAMRPVTAGNLIRPLLSCGRDEVRAWAKQEGIHWREDSSNLITAFSRNRLRLETLPALAHTYNPDIEVALAQCADLAQAEDDYWEEHIEPFYSQMAQRTPLGLQFAAGAFAGLHLSLRRRLIRRALRDLRGDLRAIEFEHVESIVRLCDSQEGHDRVVIPGVDALRSFGQLLLSRNGLRASQERDYQIDLKLGQLYPLPFHTGSLYVKWLKSGEPEDICANFKGEQERNIEICDWDGDLLAGALPSLCVRNWRPGDVFQRVGHSGEKVKSLFQSSKVLLWDRKHWPVVTAGGNIVWVRQFGPAAGVSATMGSRRILRLTYCQVECK